jgi:membrane-anchored protein YejM (alkaline phosphatase superfamily)
MEPEKIMLLNNLEKYKTYALVIFGVVLLALSVNTKITSDREQKYISDMREFKEQAKAATKYADSLKNAVGKHDSAASAAQRSAARSADAARRAGAKAGALEEQLDSLKQVVTDSVEMARVIIPKQDTIIQQYKVTVQKKDEQIVFLGIALEEKNAALIISNQRGDSLQRVVNNIPTPPLPPIFPTISRKKAFAGGVAVGIIAKALLFP